MEDSLPIFPLPPHFGSPIFIVAHLVSAGRIPVNGSEPNEDHLAGGSTQTQTKRDNPDLDMAKSSSGMAILVMVMVHIFTVVLYPGIVSESGDRYHVSTRWNACRRGTGFYFTPYCWSLGMTHASHLLAIPAITSPDVGAFLGRGTARRHWHHRYRRFHRARGPSSTSILA